ncbi:MAG: hypothetical protein A2Z30_02085 [Chloroflexi bacterium RBG_16_64_43]|nr:MAG: hypothetical protein A2Z30_02085 [Chloroflexi bacterium RBG_16_64_43]
MTDIGLTWPLMEDAAQALLVKYLPAAQAAAAPHGLSPTAWHGWLISAFFLRPQHLTLETIAKRDPYSAPARWRSRLEKAAQLGYLVQDERQGYSLTPVGEQAADGVVQAIYRAMERLQPIGEAHLEQMAALLERLVTASLAAPEPPHQWALELSRQSDPGPTAPAMIRIDQLLTDLDAYRGDCHTSAWQPLGVSGLAWEMLTLIWHGEARAAVDFESKLQRRGYRRDAFVHALDELLQRGWVAGDAQAVDITRTGRDAREAVEAQTDEYFYRPWAVLSAEERECLKQGLADFVEGLRREPAVTG